MRASYTEEHNVLNIGEIVDSISNEIELRKEDGTLVCEITSKGGDYMLAIDSFGRLRNSGKHIITIVNSYAMSAGAVIALAGDQRLMAENALMMFHMPALQSSDAMTSEELKQKSASLEACENSLVSTILSVVNANEDTVRKMLKEGKYLTAEECLSMGIITDVIPMDKRNEVVDNLCVPEMILNHVKQVERENDAMPMKEVLDQFGVTCEEGQEEAALVSYITNLLPKKVTIPAGVVNLVVKARESEINNLVVSGKIVPAVATKLKAEFTNRDRIVNVVDADGNVTDSFDSVLAALEQNTAVINFSEKTGLQKVVKDNEDADVLVNNMLSRTKGVR
jgi:ATP-dependent protease ClpP protease subunit